MKPLLHSLITFIKYFQMSHTLRVATQMPGENGNSGGKVIYLGSNDFEPAEPTPARRRWSSWISYLDQMMAKLKKISDPGGLLRNLLEGRYRAFTST